MLYSNNPDKEKIMEKVRWFLKLTPTERHNMAVSMLRFAPKKEIIKKHAARLSKTIQIIKSK